MSLKDELSKKQAHKFQLNSLDKKYIESTLLDNVEGIFNLRSDIDPSVQDSIMAFLNRKYSRAGYHFELEEKTPENPINPMIYFQNQKILAFS